MIRIFLSVFILLATEPCRASALVLSADSIRQHTRFLGHDSLQGRGTGSAGGDQAALYIANRLAQYGIRPVGEPASYFQKIPLHGSSPLPTSELKLLVNSTPICLQLGSDYLLYRLAAETIIPKPTECVFVGYGINAPEFDYNDYQSLEVEGKIVVFLSGEPPSDDPDYFNGALPTIYTYLEAKQRTAMAMGAVGSVMIPLPQYNDDKSWDQWRQEFAFEDVSLPYSVTGHLCVIMNPPAAALLFTDSRYHLNQVAAMAADHTLRSFPLAARLSFKGVFMARDFFAFNVLGLYPGQKRKPDERYILLSAHYDHLGMGPTASGDSIYNGVGDNALGVAGLLEIARAYSQLATPPMHSILFLFTTGEEKGLLGARYFVDHPLVPLYKILANINIDGLALLGDFADIIGVGAGLSTLEDDLNDFAADAGLVLAQLPPLFSDAESYARSDQIAFAQAGIPAVLLAEGLSAPNLSRAQVLERWLNWHRQVYHTPFDDLDQPIDYQSATKHAGIIFDFSHHLAQRKKPPEWRPGTPYSNERLRSIAEKR